MIRIPNPFRTLSPEELIARELDQARRGLLEAQTGRDYATAMVVYHESRIDRLRAQLTRLGYSANYADTALVKVEGQA